MRRRSASIAGIVVAAMTLSAPAAGQSRASDEPVYTLGPEITPPAPTKTVRCTYTQAAREAKIEGIVLLRAVVRRDGTVGEVTVERSLDAKLGLDDAAIAAARQWLFEPAHWKRDKEPVAVRVTIEMNFTLK